MNCCLNWSILFILALAVVTETLSFLMWASSLSIQKSENDNKSATGAKVFSSTIFFCLRALNYCQMLIAMTFNHWLILAICVFQALAGFCFSILKDSKMIE